MSDRRSARLDVVAFGAIRASTSGVSFFGAFWLLSVGRAEDFGAYLASFSVAGLVGVFLRAGVDHTLLRLRRSAGTSDTVAADLRARVVATWLRFGAATAAAGLLAAAAGVPHAGFMALGALFAGIFVLGCHLRALGRLRAAPLFEPMTVHLFGVGSMCLGASAEAALVGGATAWTALCVGVWLAILGRDMVVHRVLRARLFLRARPRRLATIAATYLLDVGGSHGVYLLIGGLHGSAALATYNALMKTNFVAEQALSFQRVFRIGDGRAKGDGSLEPEPRGGPLARLLRLVGLHRPAEAAMETALFLALAAVTNALILGVLLDHDFAPPGVWGFYGLMLALQAASLAAGPAIFAMWVYGNPGLVNLMRWVWALLFLSALVVLPARPEYWTLVYAGSIAALRLVARGVWTVARR